MICSVFPGRLIITLPGIGLLAAGAPAPSPTPLPTATPAERPKPTRTPVPTATPAPPATPIHSPRPVPADAPRFSLESGLYIGGQMVEITGEPGALVNYTLDSSEPSPTNGLASSGPITVPTEGTTVLRAITYGPG
jgi:hypothetical protein